VTGDLITVGTVAAAVASALVAGVMFAFSTSALGLTARSASLEDVFLDITDDGESSAREPQRRLCRFHAR
jgi:hypothetical protein